MTEELLKGNEALAEAAVRAGMEAYFGYPITPQTELLEYLSRRMPELGRVFVQAESEIGAINMVYGAACTGARVMTSSSSPGISLMQEGLSYIAGSEVPAVVIDIMRGGPGLGNIAPSQSDYFQVVKGGGHGDYQPIVLAPASVQEAIDIMGLAFDLAAKYRNIVFVVADGMIGQMMEPAELPRLREVTQTAPDWALTGAAGRPHRVITSLYMRDVELEKLNRRLQAKLARIQAAEVRAEEWLTDDADVLIVAFGTVARICRTAVREARRQGIRVGLLRPITLWPYPEDRLRQLADRAAAILVVEMNAGQMLDDVQRVVAERTPIRFLGKMGGVPPMPEEIVRTLKAIEAEHPVGAWHAAGAVAGVFELGGVE
jgi:2-oxoglutarate ferredoxin oxidoreductase subunit alpha